MIKHSNYFKRVAMGIIILGVIALTALGFGIHKLVATTYVDGQECTIVMDETKKTETETTTHYECSQYEFVLQQTQKDINYSDALYCFSVFLFAVAGIVIYRNHALPKE